MNNPATHPHADVVLRASNISKTYTSGPQALTVWQDVNVHVHAGESVAIVGASGSGKTTLLNTLGGLDSLNSGQVSICGHDVFALNESERTALRNTSVGFVYQFHHLLAEFSALENVMMPSLLAGVSRAEAKDRAEQQLSSLGLAERLNHKPSELSGGERQRTAIARALANSPELVLLDEPTGNLDPHTAAHVEELLLSVAESQSAAFVMVTHDHALAGRMDRQFELKDQTLHVMSA